MVWKVLPERSAHYRQAVQRCQQVFNWYANFLCRYGPITAGYLHKSLILQIFLLVRELVLSSVRKQPVCLLEEMSAPPDGGAGSNA
jgi:hypothetical protein